MADRARAGEPYCLRGAPSMLEIRRRITGLSGVQMRSHRRARCAALLAASVAASAAPAVAGPLARLFAPCRGDCGVAVYAGHYVDDAMGDVLVVDPAPPNAWTYTDDRIVALAASRELWRVGRVDFEPELGLAQRFGEQDETEAWGALFLRYRGFPWDRVVTTSVALSTGWSYATGISEIEKDRSKNDEGSRWLHFFSPEVTFALPGRPDVELLFRFHHRSGVFGLINDTHGGSQYGTVGLRVRF